MREFKQPELTGPSGEPIEVPDALAARIQESVAESAETHPGLFLRLSEGLRQAILNEARLTRNDTIEKGVVFSKEGIAIHRQRGGPDAVAIHADFLKDRVFFHNHPKGLPLSIEDVEALFSTDVETVWAVGKDWLYGTGVGPGGGGHRVRAHFRHRAHSLRNPVYAVISDRIRRGLMEADRGEAAHLHAVLCELAREEIIEYSRVRYGFGR